MILLIKQSRGIVLAVDIDELNAQLVKAGHIDQNAVDPADIFSVQINLPGNHRFRVVFHAVFRKPGIFRNLRKHRPDGGTLGAGTDHIPVGPLAQYGGNGVNDNGFTGAGFAGQNVKAPVKGNIRALNDRDILNMQ